METSTISRCEESITKLFLYSWMEMELRIPFEIGTIGFAYQKHHGTIEDFRMEITWINAVKQFNKSAIDSWNSLTQLQNLKAPINWIHKTLYHNLIFFLLFYIIWLN